MSYTLHPIAGTQLAEVLADTTVISCAADGINLLGNAYYQGFDGLIMRAEQLAPTFFDLKTRLAGEVLQKFSTYRLRLAIVGDFSVYPGRSLQDFILESNRQGQVLFVASLAEALAHLSR